MRKSLFTQLQFTNGQRLRKKKKKAIFSCSEVFAFWSSVFSRRELITWWSFWTQSGQHLGRRRQLVREHRKNTKHKFSDDEKQECQTLKHGTPGSATRHEKETKKPYQCRTQLCSCFIALLPNNTILRTNLILIKVAGKTIGNNTSEITREDNAYTSFWI